MALGRLRFYPLIKKPKWYKMAFDISKVEARRTPLIDQKHWMEERLDVFRDTILNGNNEWCFIERLEIQEELEDELANLPADERYVITLERMLDKLSTPLAEGEVFAGGMVEGPMPRLDNSYRWLSKSFFCKGHTTLDWPSMLNKGLLEIGREAKAYAARIDTEESHRFAGFALRCCVAIDKFAKRYAQAAREQAASETQTDYQQQLCRIANALEHAPGLPARSFFDALQAIWLVQLITSCIIGARDFAFGRMDQYLLPYYEGDLSRGALTRKEAKWLLAHFFVKTKEITGTAADNYRSKPVPSEASNQYLTIGGRSSNGDFMDNEVSYLILDAAMLARMPQPEINVRIDTESPLQFKQAVGRAMQDRASQIQLWNERLLLDCLLNRYPQVSVADIYDYAFTACNRIDIPGRMNVFHTGGDNWLDLPTWLLAALDNGRDPISGDILLEGLIPLEQIHSIEEILANFRCLAEKSVAAVFNAHFQRVRNMPAEAFHFESILQHDCLEKCLDVSQGGIRYPADAYLFVGIATVADSLAAIEQIIYKERRFTLPELMSIVRSDFVGQERLRQQILHNCPRYGNNDHRADHWAVTVANLAFDVVDKLKRPKEYLLVPALYSLHRHFELGIHFPATPDGRKKGEPLSENQSPSHGADISGLTALLQSAAKLPNWRTLEGGLNVRFSGKVQPEQFTAVMDTFFDMGGQHLGITVVNRDTLLDARDHPENYKDLCVRITGFSAYFNTLSPEEKQDIIDRTDY